MNQTQLTILKDRFTAYGGSFRMSDPAEQMNITLKQEHTAAVCLNCVNIAREVGLTGEDLLFAEAIALFHDIGRFRQYQEYRTFDDSRSVNHATLGAKVLLDGNMLAGLDSRERDLIVHAVTLHNVFALPYGIDETTRLFAQLVRDADKLDITRVVIDYFSRAPGDRADAVSLGLRDEPGYTPAVLESLARGEMAKKADLRTTSDFKLLQLAWLFDLNFASSLRMALDRGYIETLEGMLPDEGPVRQVVAGVNAALREKLGKAVAQGISRLSG